ncbi:hypothetical protein [Exiguobacterium sp. s13]|uniref:hypothetical protein n=1 Tax=Exiguobacterium sp. s13 TaxID=2751259 RepID=UPI001BE9401A|nr:hypothetical protein [Exiguobacterium sp. s13]
MNEQKRGKYARRVNQYSHSGFAGIVATAEMTTAEYKKLFNVGRNGSKPKNDRRQREINRRGYA